MRENDRRELAFYFIMSKALFEQIQDELFDLHNKAEEGELSNLDALIKMREAKDQADKVLEIVKDFETRRSQQIEDEISEYPKGIYKGFEIKAVAGRKSFNFKSVPEIQEIENQKKSLEEKYKSAFDGFQKRTVQTTEEDGVRYWIDNNGELKPFPELTISKGFITVKSIK